VAERLLNDASPLVRGAAVWALSQLATPDEFAALAKRARVSETDAAVRAEWMDCAAHP
jgi:epoxyqueuosine reductase